MKIFTLILFIVCVQTINTFGQSDPPPPTTETISIETKEIYQGTDEQGEQPFTYVEKMPKFPGGGEMMYKFIGENIRTPDYCKEMNVSGMVITQFIVDTAGYIIEPKVLRSPQPECGYSEEALRVLSLMNEMNQRWSSGMHNGRKVPVTFTLPIKFML